MSDPGMGLGLLECWPKKMLGPRWSAVRGWSAVRAPFERRKVGVHAGVPTEIAQII